MQFRHICVSHAWAAPRYDRSGEEVGLPGGTSKGDVSRLEDDLARALVCQHLALDALERVVDRLRVAAELGGHLFVGRPLEVQAERVRLELRQARSEREDEALELLRRDDADRGVVDARARQRVAEGALAVA